MLRENTINDIKDNPNPSILYELKDKIINYAKRNYIKPVQLNDGKHFVLKFNNKVYSFIEKEQDSTHIFKEVFPETANIYEVSYLIYNLIDIEKIMNNNPHVYSEYLKELKLDEIITFLYIEGYPKDKILEKINNFYK